ncbi:zinc-binding dehydrogenase [Rhizobium laguerreae]|uniref:zinc-binding dehydrogenase n=1 Tax=Rhizobium laguerreae TaxID=1076926 RepID=UPI001FE81222|nr:zinc-binding dehydrogenase [Rhizobium laguerreae]
MTENLGKPRRIFDEHQLEGQVPTVELMRKQIHLQGLVVGSRRDQQNYIAALEATGVRPVIDRTFAFGELPEAFANRLSGEHFGKICVEW